MREEQLKEIQTVQMGIYGKIVEVTRLTEELDEAVNRQDTVSVRILLYSRRKPVYELCSAWAEMKLTGYELTDGETEEYSRILAGDTDGPAANRAAAMQQMTNRRLLERLRSMDRAVNQKICRKKTFYRETVS